MCLVLNDEELIHTIKSLEKDLFILQRNAEIHNVLDGRLPNVKSTIDKMRVELESRNISKN